MKPVQTQFTQPSLTWFTRRFFDEFGPHHSWECPILHPILNGANKIEESELAYDHRERLIKLLTYLGRMMRFDNANFCLSLVITFVVTTLYTLWLWPIVAQLLLPAMTSWSATAAHTVGSILTAVFVVHVGMTISRRTIEAVRKRREIYEQMLNDAAGLYTGDLLLARADIHNLSAAGIGMSKELHGDFINQVTILYVLHEGRKAGLGS